MKRLLFLLLIITWGANCKAQIRSAVLTASGLTCSMCSKAIYKSLGRLSFVKTVTSDVEKSTFGISFKDGATVVPDDIKKAVQDAGFSVASLKLTASFSNTPVENDAHITIGNNAFHFVDVPKQTLNGDRVLTIVDKNFISAKEHKKYAQFTKMKCYETGTMASCCPKDKNTGTRIYHVTL